MAFQNTSLREVFYLHFNNLAVNSTIYNTEDGSTWTGQPDGSVLPVPVANSSLSIVSITYANLRILKLADNLIPNTTYYITDRYVWLKSLSVDELSFAGQYFAFNADYQVAGDYSGIPGFVSQLGIWNTGLAPVINDVVIWNNLHYKNLTGAVGTDPSGDAINWLELPLSVTNGYINEIDDIEFDFDYELFAVPQGSIVYRSDKRGNTVRTSQISNTLLGLANGNSAIKYFQWGSDATAGCQIDNSFFNNRNCYTGQNGVVATGLSVINLSDFANLSYSNIGEGSGVTMIGNSSATNAEIMYSLLFSMQGDSLFNGGVITGGSLFAASGMANCNLAVISIASTLTADDFAECQGIEITNQSNITANNTAIIKNSYISGLSQTFDGTNDGQNKHYEIGYSTFDNNSTAMNITGLTTIDLSTTFALFSHCGLLYLTSTNATESLDTLISATSESRPITFVPETGLTVTIANTQLAVGKFTTVSANPVFNGTKGDIFTFTRNNSGYWLQTEPTNTYL